jgi:UDP-N-acetylmuramate--alanine ligase
MEKSPRLPADLRNLNLYFVGIKGTGMSALAELCLRMGARVSGSDTRETFYTDAVLQELGIPYREGFDRENVPEGTDFLIYSAAYDPALHVELLEAARRSIPIMEYTRALGELSRGIYSVGIAGVHGKTTTTALLGSIVKELGLPGFVLVGSAVKGFQNRATYYGGRRFFIAETCEYRRHFLSFHPDQIVITTVDVDHLDYYRDYDDIESAFLEYTMKLPEAGRFVYCADDRGALVLAHKVRLSRPDLRMIPYGRAAEGAYRITASGTGKGFQWFRMEGRDCPIRISVPGKHSVLNAAAAAAAAEGIFEELGMDFEDSVFEKLAEGVANFAGSTRRSEILGEKGGILFVDDYGHHPREISSTIQGFREFYPGRRVVVDFMSHTYTRTAALLEDFGRSFGEADAVILHKIYASAREETGKVNGRSLFEKVREHHGEVYYFEEFDPAEDFLREYLQPGDLFITLGAGDNWRLGQRLYDYFSRRGDEKK